MERELPALKTLTSVGDIWDRRQTPATASLVNVVSNSSRLPNKLDSATKHMTCFRRSNTRQPYTRLDIVSRSNTSIRRGHVFVMLRLISFGHERRIWAEAGVSTNYAMNRTAANAVPWLSGGYAILECPRAEEQTLDPKGHSKSTRTTAWDSKTTTKASEETCRQPAPAVSDDSGYTTLQARSRVSLRSQCAALRTAARLSPQDSRMFCVGPKQPVPARTVRSSSGIRGSLRLCFFWLFCFVLFCLNDINATIL